MKEINNSYRILYVRPEGERPPRRPRRKQEDNIKIDLREICSEYVDLIYLRPHMGRWRAAVNTVMNLQVP
jgi:hypothetical protein